MPKSGFIFDGISKTYLHHSDIQYVQAWGLVVQWSAHQLWCPRSWVQTRPHPQRLKCALALCQFGSLNEATTFFFFFVTMCRHVTMYRYVQVYAGMCQVLVWKYLQSFGFIQTANWQRTGTSCVLWKRPGLNPGPWAL